MHNAPKLIGRSTWRPPKRTPRFWQRGLSASERLVVTPAGWVLARLTGLLSQRHMALLNAAFARQALAVFPARAEHQYAPRLYGASFAKLDSPLDDRDFMRDADAVLGHRRTKLYYDRLHVLYQALHEVARGFPDGELRLLEGGAFRGGTSFFLLRTAERMAPGRTRLWAVDTFEGHTEEDMGGSREGGQTTAVARGKPFDASFEDVVEYLAEFPSATVLKGRIQELEDQLPAPPLHFIHLDMNVYKPTRFGLELARRRLAQGGIVILDDYSNVNCPGVARAVAELLESRGGGAFSKLVLPTGQCWLVALRAPDEPPEG